MVLSHIDSVGFVQFLTFYVLSHFICVVGHSFMIIALCPFGGGHISLLTVCYVESGMCIFHSLIRFLVMSSVIQYAL